MFSRIVETGIQDDWGGGEKTWKGSTCNNTSEKNSGNVVGGKLNLMCVIIGEDM